MIYKANYRIEKTATGYSLGGLKFNDSTSNAVYAKNGWTFIINQKKKRTIEITVPSVGTAKFKYDNFGNLEPLDPNVLGRKQGRCTRPDAMGIRLHK